MLGRSIARRPRWDVFAPGECWSRRSPATVAARVYSASARRDTSTDQNPKPQHAKSQHTAKPHPINPRWLTTVKKRIGKCLSFGLHPTQVDEAGVLLQQLASDWRELVAGSEGFLTDETRRGLFRHNVVWGEMDIMARHVNNVTYVRYAETARINFMRNLAVHVDPTHRKQWTELCSSTGIGLILRSIKVDYKFPMTWPDKITVYHKLAHDPDSFSSHSAFELQVMILSEARQRPAARCHEDIVTYDYKLGAKTPSLPAFVKNQFKTMWAKQQEAKKTWQQRILDIEEDVRQLEAASWDRPDAVEDMGAAPGTIPSKT